MFLAVLETPHEDMMERENEAHQQQLITEFFKEMLQRFRIAHRGTDLKMNGQNRCGKNEIFGC